MKSVNSKKELAEAHRAADFHKEQREQAEVGAAIARNELRDSAILACGAQESRRVLNTKYQPLRKAALLVVHTLARHDFTEYPEALNALLALNRAICVEWPDEKA